VTTEPTDNEYRQQRLENLRQLEALGRKPYGGAFPRTGRLAEIRAGFQEEARARHWGDI